MEKIEHITTTEPEQVMLEAEQVERIVRHGLARIIRPEQAIGESSPMVHPTGGSSVTALTDTVNQHMGGLARRPFTE